MTVNVHQSARDLQGIAKNVVANPTAGKRIRHSKLASPFRRAVQSPGAMASAVGGAVKKGVSLALGQIPVPVVGTLLDKAWTVCTERLRAKAYATHIKYPVNSADMVKFELKTLAGEVAEFDRYRWKISHSVENYNKVVTEVMSGIEASPCDAWVRVWSKYYYLGSRIGKLRAAVEAVRAILLATDTWLDEVEQSYAKSFDQMQAQYATDVSQLKTMAGAHEDCSKHTCMFKTGRWTDKPSVPTSEAALFLIKGVKTVAEAFGDDPVGDIVGNIPD